jgi:hypothetical protein
MVHQPVIQALVAAQEKKRGKEQQGSRRKHWNECAQDSEPE